ncbi:mycothiol-dependent nitroreductase Rv2466c family protein [Mycolicibacterium vinylchloridicum]|uniref:mycothiol-dependent nitroreductase Rv2466c family protein n=1 Tax=Mycolicibacterium vinylchloridicum TaxID=2736928 RepID=UPI00022E8D84|nr:hypothetical protein [Mycolicibacterium vinylchloridicum]EHB53315.1 DsbA oxidoreductase [Mycolicibacterium rhodesiae JS60]
MSDNNIKVDFWFDPFCPWAWITSRWLTEVQQYRDVTVDFHFAALAIIDEDDPPKFLKIPEISSKVWLALRVVAETDRSYSSADLTKLYAALGGKIHGGKNLSIMDILNKDIAGFVVDSVAEAGLPSSILDTPDSPELDAAIRASIDRGLRAPGAIAGVPTLHINGVPFFGPVLSAIPRGHAAVRLWDAVATVAAHPDFWELKRQQPDDLAPITS